MLDRLPDQSMVTDENELKKIQARVLMLYGDQDPVVPIETALFARKHLPKAHLWVLPNTGHDSHEGKNKREFVRVSKEFFNHNWDK